MPGQAGVALLLLLYLMRAFFALMLIACVSMAVVCFPRHDQAARSRLLWLLLLLLPLAGAFGFGPFVIDHHALSPDARRRMIALQQVMLGGYAVFPAVLLPFMRGGRLFATAVGAGVALVGFAIAAVSILIIDPGS
jgi:hypothetical protein